MAFYYNAEQPAFPVKDIENGITITRFGMSKREYMATQFMATILSTHKGVITKAELQNVAVGSVLAADVLLHTLSEMTL